jgi:DNA repair exonuclease SbcCD ATPase subunit
MDPQDLQEVRKLIEKSTSKVSLRDLEKKGFRKVKVLRSNDIDELIRRAVHAVVAREGADSPDQEALVQKSKEELRTLMTAAQAAEQERAELAAEKEELEAQVRDLRARLQQRTDLEGKLKELQRRLADEEDARRRAEAQLGTADVASKSRIEELERRADEAEDLAAAAGRKLADLERQRQDREREMAGLRRRLEEAEARSLALDSRATAAEETNARLAAARNEAEALRSRVQQLETESRLTAELEIPKLRLRIAELEQDLRAARAAGQQQPAPAAGLSPEQMRAMFRDLLSEVGAGRGGGVDSSIKEEFAKMQRTIAESLARAGGRGAGEVTEADFAAAKVSLEKLFSHDEGPKVQSNIDAVEVKERTTATSNVKSNLNKLKSLRKGGSSE